MAKTPKFTDPAARVIGHFIERKRYPNGRTTKTTPVITQADLSERSGLYQPSISEWERGTATPSAVNFCRLMKHLGVEPMELHRLVMDVANTAEATRGEAA